MKYFLKNYWAMKYLGLWSPGLRLSFEKFVKPSGTPSCILNACFLTRQSSIHNQMMII